MLPGPSIFACFWQKCRSPRWSGVLLACPSRPSRCFISMATFLPKSSSGSLAPCDNEGGGAPHAVPGQKTPRKDPGPFPWPALAQRASRPASPLDLRNCWKRELWQNKRKRSFNIYFKAEWGKAVPRPRKCREAVGMPEAGGGTEDGLGKARRCCGDTGTHQDPITRGSGALQLQGERVPIPGASCLSQGWV